ncbi:MAG: hypothetical protein ACJAXA_000286 [Candidatus Aldehydirespiratoraceae bacterium]|jgi:hypothetical protein
MLLLSAAGGAQGQANDPPNATGMCAGEAVVTGGPVMDPYQSIGVYEIPLEGDASYSGIAGSGEDRDEREFNGRVFIEAPAFVPRIELTEEWTWSGPGTAARETGNVNWKLPELTPRGVPIKVVGFHQDSPERCDGHVFVEVEGWFFDSILGAGALGGTAVPVAGVALAGLRRGATA